MTKHSSLPVPSSANPTWAGLPLPAAMLLLFLMLFLARSIVTFPIEHSDAAHKYIAAASIVRTGEFTPLLANHHTLRWSEVLPQTLVTALTGFRYEGLYLLPLLLFGLTGTLLWAAMRHHLNVPQQGMLLLLFFLEPLALKHTGQLLNPPFGVFYTLLALLLLARKEHSGWMATLGAAGLFFAAYGAHSTYLAFSAVGFIWLWFREKQPAKAMVLAGTMVALVLLETLAFNVLSGGELSLGRFEKLASGGHTTAVMTRFESVQPLDLLTRWLKLPLFNLALMAGFMLTLGWLALNSKARQAAPSFVLLSVLAGAIYAIAVSFAILDWQPLRPLMPLRNMYLEPVMVFAIIGSMYGLRQVLLRLNARVTWAINGALAFAMVTALALFAQQQQSSWERLLNYRLSAFVWQSQAEFSALAERFYGGRVILQGPNRRAVLNIIRYQYPSNKRWKASAQQIWSGRIKDDVRCLNRLRQVPLIDNETHCKPADKRAARSAKRL